MAKKRKMGEGTLRHRKDGRWEGRMVIGYDEKGLPKTRSVLAKTKKECLEKLEKLKTEEFVFTGRLPNHAKPDMPFGEWIKIWYIAFSKPAIRPATQKVYEMNIRTHIIPMIGKIPLNKLQQSDLQAFYAELKSNGRVRHRELYGSGLSNRIVRACHAMCRMALEKAVERPQSRKLAPQRRRERAGRAERREERARRCIPGRRPSERSARVHAPDERRELRDVGRIPVPRVSRHSALRKEMRPEALQQRIARRVRIRFREHLSPSRSCRCWTECP